MRRRSISNRFADLGGAVGVLVFLLIILAFTILPYYVIAHFVIKYW